MNRWIGKVAVVTGASAGIGLFTAKALVDSGMVVIGLARRKDKMEEEMKDTKGKFYAMECDVAKNDNVVAVFNEIERKFGSVHVLVNNAGVLLKGATAEMDIEKIKRVIDVNLLGLIYCARQAINLMKKGKHEGLVINVGSYLGHKVLKVDNFNTNVYPATKFAVRALSQSLQNELQNTKIRVTHVSPGIVKTEIFELSGVDPSFLEVSAGLESEDVADAIVYIIGTKPHVNIPELTIMHAQDHFR